MEIAKQTSLNFLDLDNVIILTMNAVVTAKEWCKKMLAKDPLHEMFQSAMFGVHLNIYSFT